MKENMAEKNEKKEDCVFCRIANGDIPAVKIHEDDNFFVIDDKNPVSEGHCMIIPKKHYETLLDVPSTMGTEILAIAKQQALRLIKEKKAEGIKIVNNNFSAAGQVVNHFHVHVIPEKKGVKREKHV